MAEATGTQAIDRAAQLLVRVVESTQPPSVGELAERAGLPKSTTSRLVSALERQGLVQRLGDRGRVAAGPVLLRYAHRDVSPTLVELAAPSLRRLADASGLAPAPALTGDEVVSNAAVMMFGGIETTEGMIVNLVYHLLLHGVGDPSRIPNALEESLRLEPAAAVVDRYATRDVLLAGASIRKGDFVEVSLAGANRDPAFFPDPDRFDVDRENARHHLAFAQGPHVCVGMHLARLETQIAAERLFARLPGLRLDPGRPTAPRGLVFRKVPRLDVLWDRR